MSTTARNDQITKEVPSVPKIAVGILLGILVFGVFVVGYDQGQLFSIFQGQQAYGDMWMHEFTHDMRHSAGFACH
ncbi:MAG: CbtB domain-containing protein [Nitrososphaera sp.]